MMTTKQFDHIKNPIARAEALRAQAIADMFINALNGLRSLVKTAWAKVVAYRGYRATVDALSAMSDRELSDIGIARGDIPAVARGIDPRPAEQRPGDALAQRLALAEAFEQEKDDKVVELRSNDNRPAAAA